MKNVDDWQKLTPNTTSADAIFYQFCDALEVKDGQSANENGWGLDQAIQGWGTFWNNTYYQQRESYS